MLLPTWLLHKHTQTNKLHCLWSTVYTGQSRPPPPPSSLAVVLTSSSVFPLSHHASTLCLSNMVSLQKRSCVCQRSTRRKFRLVGTDETYLEHVDESFTHTHTHTHTHSCSSHHSTTPPLVVTQIPSAVSFPFVPSSPPNRSERKKEKAQALSVTSVSEGRSTDQSSIPTVFRE